MWQEKTLLLTLFTWSFFIFLSSDILKMFNPSLKGFSKGVGSLQKGFNMAASGAKTSYVPFLFSITFTELIVVTSLTSTTCICSNTEQSQHKSKLLSRPWKRIRSDTPKTKSFIKQIVYLCHAHILYTCSTGSEFWNGLETCDNIRRGEWSLPLLHRPSKCSLKSQCIWRTTHFLCDVVELR